MQGNSRIKSTVLLAAIASTFIVAGVQAQPLFQKVTIQFPARTWVYCNGNDVTAEGVIGFIQDCSGTGTIGNIFRTVEVGFQGVQMPAQPYQLDSISITCGITPTWPLTNVTLFFDGNSNDGTQFTTGMGCTNTGDFCIMGTYSFAADPAIVSMDFGGSHNLWAQFDGGGDVGQGCGNFATLVLTFRNGGTGVRAQHSVNAPAQSVQRVRGVSLSSRTPMPATALYDVHGRTIGSSIGMFHGVTIAPRAFVSK